MTDAQIHAALAHLGPGIAAMVVLQRFTGMRPDEVCAISMEEIDCSDPGRGIAVGSRS